MGASGAGIWHAAWLCNRPSQHKNRFSKKTRPCCSTRALSKGVAGAYLPSSRAARALGSGCDENIWSMALDLPSLKAASLRRPEAMALVS